MTDELTDTVILSVALVSGRFKTELRVPLFGDSRSKEKAVESWLSFIQTAFEIGATHAHVVMEKKPS